MIVIPGLGEEVGRMKLATGFWKRYGLEPIVHAVGWKDGENFQPKLERLVRLVDELADRKNMVSVVGTSAGGSAALNTFIERKREINKAANICGRLRIGTHIGMHSFEKRTASSPAFAQSVVMFERREKELTKADRKRILTMHALGFDELVPAETTYIEGAENRIIPVPEHMFSIAMTLTLLSKPLIDFLSS